MKTPREDATRTRRSLLKAACEVFAEKGYRDATISEISARSGANIAAVNYHFGNKENLYVEAWRCAFQASLEAHPPDGGAKTGAPPEERLLAHVTATLQRLADKKNREFWFVQREFANPTGLLEEVMRQEIHPLQKRTQGLVRELLGPQASEREIRFCETSIISQCVNPMVVGKKPQGKNAGKGDGPEIKDLAAYADHIVRFSLAGLQAVRRETEVKKNEKCNKRSGRKINHETRR